jgi:hypothetical protein
MSGLVFDAFAMAIEPENTPLALALPEGFSGHPGSGKSL